MLGGRHHAKVRLCCLSKAINLDLGESVLIIRVSAAARLLSLTAVKGGWGKACLLFLLQTKQVPLKVVVLSLGCMLDSEALTLAPAWFLPTLGFWFNWSWVQTGLGQCFLHCVSRNTEFASSRYVDLQGLPSGQTWFILFGGYTIGYPHPTWGSGPLVLSPACIVKLPGKL